MGSGRVWQDDTDSTWAFVLHTGDGLLTHSGYSSEVSAFEAMDGIRVQLDKRRPGGSGRALARTVREDLPGGASRALDELVRLAGEAEGLREALRQAHVWVADAIESTGDSDDELLAEPGTLWARLIAARDAMGAALEVD